MGKKSSKKTKPRNKKHQNKFSRISIKRITNIVFISILAVLAVLYLLRFVDTNPKWIQPEVLKSIDGVLDVTLNAKNSNVKIGDTQTQSNVYNGKYINDSWDVKGGDTIRVHLKNNITEPTNLHFHGAHVSPKGNSDNVLLNINPGQDFNYEYKLPKDHPPGLYWYHPHRHEFTDDQVASGMLGAITVRGKTDELPGIRGVAEKQLVLTTQDPANSSTINRLVNNQVDPTLYVRPFETVRLKILNGSSDDFYNLSIPGKKLNVFSRDGNTLSQVDKVESEVMAPGDRIEVLFQAGANGEFPVKSLVYDAGSFTYPEATFMKIKIQGLPVLPTILPHKLLPHDNLANAKIDKVRTLTFTEGGTAANPTFLLDGQQFNPNVVSQTITLGTTEEWHLVNNSQDTHPFHIHVNPFQVISVNGKPVDRYGYDDTFPVPANGKVVMRTRYKDFDGKFVLHCHILFHEDHGMMQVVEIVRPGENSKSNNGAPGHEGMEHMHDMP